MVKSELNHKVAMTDVAIVNMVKSELNLKVAMTDVTSCDHCKYGEIRNKSQSCYN